MRWSDALPLILAVLALVPRGVHGGRGKDLLDGMKQTRSFETVLDQAYDAIEAHREGN